jgi:DNA-binding NarL/FixJ family response regulator
MGPENEKFPPSDCKPRILLADDHRLMLETMSRLLEPEFEIVDRLPDGALVAERCAALKPAAVVLDIRMPGMGGIEAAQELIRSASSVKIVFLSIEQDPEYVRLATSMKASYVFKARMHQDLIGAIKEAIGGRSFVSPLGSSEAGS